MFTDGELKQGGSTLLNRIVASQLSEAMLEAVKTELGGRGFPLIARAGADGIRLVSDGRTTALLKATCAEFGGRANPIQGQFLRAGGPSWEVLRRQLHRFFVAEVLTEFPSSEPEMQIQAAQATEMLRKERTVEYGHTVVLRQADKTVRFDPIPEHGAVELPFEYRERHEHLSGGIRLKAPGLVLALAIADRSDDLGIIPRAWLFALAGYAELCCVAFEAPDVERVNTLGGTRSGKSSGTSERQERARSHGPRGGAASSLPSSLTPTQSTLRHLASYVMGHKRHLGVNRHPSPEARRRAEHLGIALALNETWVRPHARGVPDDAALVFEWAPKAR